MLTKQDLINIRAKHNLSDTQLLHVAAYNDFYRYMLAIEPSIKPWIHTKYLCREVERLIRLGKKRIVINLPPQVGKSTLLTYLEGWLRGRNPKLDTIYASSIVDLATRAGSGIITQLSDPLYHEIFSETRLEKSNPSSVCFRTSLGGTYYAKSIWGGISGLHASLFIIDDPSKDMRMAASPTFQRAFADQYESVVKTRLHPNSIILFVQTRWHVNDPTGWVLTSRAHEDWSVIRIPAIAEETYDENGVLIPDPLGRNVGESICEEIRPISELLEDQKAAPRSFAALYQQRPFIQSGNFFRPSWFNIIGGVDQRNTRIVRFWDMASTVQEGSKDPDWTVGTKGLIRDGRLIVLDSVRFRDTPLNARNRIRQVAEIDGRDTLIRMEMEGGSSGKAIIDVYSREILQGFNFSGIRPRLSKTQRAEAVAALAENGNVDFVRGDWNTWALSELELFPEGPHDDFTDTLSGLHEALFSTGFTSVRGVR